MVGLPAVLVPYPFAPDDHQTVNARVLVDAGAALLVRDHDATAEQLAPQVEQLLADPGRLAAMGVAAGHVARPHAAEALAAWVLELARQGRAGQGRHRQGRAGQGRHRQGRAGQGRHRRGRAGQGRHDDGRPAQGDR